MCFYRLPFDFYLPKTHFVMFECWRFEFIGSDFWFPFLFFWKNWLKWWFLLKIFAGRASKVLWQRRPRLHFDTWRVWNFENFYKKWDNDLCFSKTEFWKQGENLTVQWWELLKWCFMKDIPLACWSFMTSQDKNWLNPRPKTSKFKTR